ncbi:MAG TPA: hypothetical protein VN702_13195, partial [Acetobacteraceae bacterium]|nr:hypothetical protein [Acetobacteraceae bacterium]
AAVNGFAVSGGDFLLNDTGNLWINGPVTAANVTFQTNGAGRISASGSIGAAGALTVDSGSGGIALVSGADLTGTSISLDGAAGGISLSGNAILGTPGALIDLTTTGGITEAASSTILAGTLQSGAGIAGSVSLGGAANAIATLGQFQLGSGDFTLVDTGNLVVAGPVSATNIAISDIGDSRITVSGMLAASTAGGSLTVISGAASAGTSSPSGTVGGGITFTGGAVATGSAITLDGAANGITLDGNAIVGNAGAVIDLQGGGVSEAASARLIAGSLRRSSGSAGTVSLAGTANAVAELASFVVPAGDFNLADTGNLTVDGPVSATNVALFTSGGGAIATNGFISASGTLALASGTGGIAINAGSLNGTTVDLTAPGSGVTESANAAISAGTLQSSGGITGTVNLPGGANAIDAIGSLPVAGDFTLYDNAALSVSGALVADTITLTDASSIAIPGLLRDAAGSSTNLFALNGSITETGTLIAGTLNGRAATGASFTGSTATTNQIQQLGSFTAGAAQPSTLTVNTGTDLLISGPVSAHKFIVNAPNNTVTLGNGAQLLVDGRIRPPGAIPTSLLPTAATDNGAFITAANFLQSGRSSVAGLTQPYSILRIDVTGKLTLDPSTGLQAPLTWLILGLAGGQATGNLVTGGLDIVHTGGAGAVLTGTVNKLGGSAAAGASNIEPQANPSFRFNSCPIHSVNCVLLPTQGVPQSNPLQDIYLGSLFDPNDQDDLLLPIVSDQDY